MKSYAGAKQRNLIVALAFFTALLIFVSDSFIQLGVSAGVGYVIVICMVYLTGEIYPVWAAAVICSIFTILGFLISPGGGDNWKIIANRGISVGVIWLVSAFSVKNLSLLSDLRKSKERLRLVVESARDHAILTLAPDGLVTSWNSGAKRITGYDAEEILGHHFSSFYSKTDSEKGLPETVLKQAEQGEIYRAEGWKVRKDSSKYWATIAVSKLGSDHGEQAGFTMVIRDNTERKHNLEKLEQYADDLERSNKDLDEFAYVASHDLRSPLAGIKNLASWIADDNVDTLKEESKRHLDLMQRRLVRLEALLEDLLQYSRVGRIHDEIVAVNIAELIRETVDFQDFPKAYQVKVSSEMPIFKTARTPLELIFRNLLGNAVKHHDRDEGGIEIACHDDGSSFYEFVVTDDGPGIDPKFHKQIFKMFETLQPRDEMEGSGMGLALIRKIVKSYEGEIHVDSDGKRGASFRFTWPKFMEIDAEELVSN